MFTFLIILILVFVGVDLLVRFIVDPYLAGSKKKNKATKSFTPKFDPSFKLATETMYDGGKKHDEKESNDKAKVENIKKDVSEN